MTRVNVKALETVLGNKAFAVDKSTKGYACKFICKVRELEEVMEFIKNKIRDNNVEVLEITSSIKHTFRGDLGQVKVIVPFNNEEG